MDERVGSFFKTRVAEFKNENCKVTLNGKVVSWEQVIGMKLSGKKVYFKVSAW